MDYVKTGEPCKYCKLQEPVAQKDLRWTPAVSFDEGDLHIAQYAKHNKKSC